MSVSNPMACYHCQLDVPPQTDFFVINDQGERLAMCCQGCKAVTEMILGLKLSQFYQYRDAFPNKAIDSQLLNVNNFAAFDTAEIYDEYVTLSSHEPLGHSITLYIEGIHCSACVWLIEHRMRQLDGVDMCQVNLSNHQAFLSWQKSSLKLSQLLLAISELGYKAHLCQQGELEAHNQKEAHKALRRIGMAGLGAMQVMMIAVGLYAGGLQGIEAQYQSFLQWSSMFVTLPIFFYAGKPFISSAIRSLRSKQLGMDVPISLALVVILLQSIFATVHGLKDVYFDSVCMFLFFLTLGRYLEMRVRHKASDLIFQLTKLLPTTALRVTLVAEKVKTQERLPVNSLRKGDVVLVSKGQNFPTDGLLLSKRTSVNEAMLTGEFMPKAKQKGDRLYAGTQNHGQETLMTVTKTGNSTRLLSITHLLSKAQSERPSAVSMVNKLARWFTAFVLIAASVVGIVWTMIDSTQAISVMVSVLVISCPCALSLATPIALTVSMSRLSQLGFLVLNNRVIEGFSDITHCVFDKTGTLTLGELTLTDVDCLSDKDEKAVLSIAGGLELISEHPVAQSLLASMHRQQISPATVVEAKEELNHGVSGMIEGKHYRLGKLSFAKAQYDEAVSFDFRSNASLVILLSDETGPLALFYFADQLRAGAKNTIDWLKEKKIKPILLSGDGSCAVMRVANELGISTYYQDKTPTQKHDIIKALSINEQRVLMVGDGANDALAMAGAYLSFAMGAGTDLAKTSSDAVLLNNDITLLRRVYEQTSRARSIIKQNIAWALIYNVIALPIAASGLVAPYVAVIGMSISSLFVTLNALRLRQVNRQEESALMKPSSGGVAV